MTWTGDLPLGLFKGVRNFVLQTAADGYVAVTVNETFSGSLLPVLVCSLPDMSKPVADLVAGLNARAERA